MYEFDDDEGRGRGRAAALVTAAVLALGGWFVARPAMSGGTEGGSGALVLDPPATSSTVPASTTSRPIATTGLAIAEVAMTSVAPTTAAPTTVAPTTAAPTTATPSIAPPRAVVESTLPSLPFATVPDGTPAPVELAISSTQVLLTGNVPSQRAADRLVALADGLTLVSVPIVDELTINPSVPDSIAVRVVERNAIVFNEGSDTVHEDHARQLDRFVLVLNTFPGATVLITAHADQRNDAERNQTISEERAQSVADYLVAQGIDIGRISAMGAGESEPLVLAETDVAYAVNRRVDFLFAGLLSG